MLLSGRTRRASRFPPDAEGVLDELTAGKTVDQIGAARNLTRMRVERILRAELKAFSIRPAHDYVKLQIRRLESVIVKLTEKANDGDLGAVDRLMRMLDRLDRYHGFGKAPAKDPKRSARDDEAFKRKLADLVVRARKARQQNDERSRESAESAQGPAAPRLRD